MIAFERLSDSTLHTIGAGALLDAVPSDWPHLEYLVSPGFVGNFSDLTSTSEEPKDPVGQQYASILSALVAPQSRGTISLQSADMADAPIIGPFHRPSTTAVSGQAADSVGSIHSCLKQTRNGSRLRSTRPSPSRASAACGSSLRQP